MKNKTLKKLAVTAVLGVAFLGVSAQVNCSSSGSSSIGSIGSFSFSVGQTTIFHSPTPTSALGKNSTSQEPVLEKTTLLQGIAVFPNPTDQGFKLSFKDFDPTKTSVYVLTDIQGRFIESKEITSSETYVNLENLIAGNYLLQVNQNNQNIQTFNIIKTN